MSTPKNESAVYGFKKDRAVYLNEFKPPVDLNWARQRAKQFGIS
jgi:hypothetical protein